MYHQIHSQNTLNYELELGGPQTDCVGIIKPIYQDTSNSELG